MPIPYLNQIVCGDARDLIKDIPKESIDLIITSPPFFNMRDYNSKSTYEIGSELELDLYLWNLQKIFIDCVSIIKKTGSIVINLGDKYEHEGLMLIPYKFAIDALEWNSSVRLINNITWIKMNPQPRQFKRRAVSSTEPFFHFVKGNKYKYNLEPDPPQMLAGDNIGQGYFKQIKQSELSETEKTNAKQALEIAINEVKSGKISGLRMKIRGVHALPFGGQPGGRLTQITNNGFTIIKLKGGKMHRDVIECPVTTIPGVKHIAVYPESIVEHFIKLTTDENDIVLDPFVGSGTSCIAAKKLGRQYIGFDLSQKFVDYASKRLKVDTGTVDE